MNKKILIPLIVVVVIAGGFYFFRQQPSSTNEVAPSSATPPMTDCVGICLPFDSQKNFNDEVNLGNGKDYTDPVTKNVIKFKLLTNTPIQTRNPTFEIYVNGKLSGTASGQGISQTSFSPDHKHFAFRTSSTVGCVGSCQSLMLYVIDLSQPSSMRLLVTTNSGAKNSKAFQFSSTFIDSYSWGDDNTILPTVYSVSMGQSGKYYRTSSKEVWSFNLANPESIMRNGVLVNTLAE